MTLIVQTAYAIKYCKEMNLRYIRKEIHWKEIKAGDIIRFGTDPTVEEPEDMYWQVLEAQENKLLLISLYGMKMGDLGKWHREDENVRTESPWENSAVRSWLNNEFLESVFTVLEREAIITSTVENDAKQGKAGWFIGEEKNTEDKIFLLSIAETEHYFPNSSERICQLNNQSETGWWRLRSSGYRQDLVAGINTNGYLMSFYSDDLSGLIRPVLWLDYTMIP